ncbi:MAG: alpha/beta fold hydrolase [Candidatus Methylomirabilaceae bacterium]
MTRFRAILLPGGVLPAALAYPDLVAALGPEVDARYKELELYAGDEPPPRWDLDREVEGIRRFAEECGFDRFHLVGYSGGGACALAYCAADPERLLSLTLNEPAWAGNEGWSDAERGYWRRVDEIMALPPEEMMTAFMQSGQPPEDEPSLPDPEPPPPWFASRPAGLRAFHSAFKAYHLDLDRLKSFDRPVLYVTGGKSDPIENEPIVERLSKVFPDFTREIYAERHHFDPPHRAEPERFAASLKTLWERAADES